MKKIINGKLYDTDSMVLLFSHSLHRFDNYFKIVLSADLFFTKNSKEYVLLEGKHFNPMDGDKERYRCDEDFP